MAAAGEAQALLDAAYPWGAHVTVAAGSEFVSLEYEVLGELSGGTKYAIRFVRDPGDAVAEVARSELEKSAATGELTFDGGGNARRPEVRDLHLLADPIRHFIGPQSHGEGRWIARMRLHQSWWRTFRLRTPFGNGPKEGSKKPYGNMLTKADGDAGRNFLSGEACASYDDRWALTKVGIDPFRTRRHLMASQTMAFNVFGHLDKHRDLAAGLFDALIGPGEVDAVTSIEIERLSDALGDHTAFDAFVTYRRPDNGPGCIAIETKLTEPFSQADYDWAHYLGHSAFDATVWNTTDPAVLGDRRWSQLWRNHLLARAEGAAHSLGPTSVLVVHHPEDHDCDTTVRDYCKHLHEGHPVQGVDLGRIHEILADLVATGHGEQQAWLDDLADRYLNLHLSETLVPLARG